MAKVTARDKDGNVLLETEGDAETVVRALKALDVAKEIVGVLGPYSSEERAQLLLQAEAILDARESGSAVTADALLDAFKDGYLEAKRSHDGKVLLRLTEIGMVKAAALVREASGQKPH